MKKSLLTAAVLSFAISQTHAQIKLGNNPSSINADALLEMESTNKGLLLPRVALTNTTAFAPLAAHVAGMTVYNTATAGDVTPGTYYNDGTKWVRIASAGAVNPTLYSSDGSLGGTRTVTMGTNDLIFSGAGKVGIGRTPVADKLEVAGQIRFGGDTYNGVGSIFNDATGEKYGITQAGGAQLGGSGQGTRIYASGAGGVEGHISFGKYTSATNFTEFARFKEGTGFLGIGTTDPTAKLEVAGQVKITGGTPGAGKVLMSDATGLATWSTPASLTGSLAGAYNPIGTTNLVMAAGAAEADIPGVTQTFTLTQAATVNIIATGIASNFSVAEADIQGSFKINVNGVNMTSGFASSGHRPALSSMPTPITLSYNAVLAAGTHTIKLRYKPWYGGANINVNAFTAGYVGAVAIDADALKSRMSILIFNN